MMRSVVGGIRMKTGIFSQLSEFFQIVPHAWLIDCYYQFFGQIFGSVLYMY